MLSFSIKEDLYLLLPKELLDLILDKFYYVDEKEFFYEQNLNEYYINIYNKKVEEFNIKNFRYSLLKRGNEDKIKFLAFDRLTKYDELKGIDVEAADKLFQETSFVRLFNDLLNNILKCEIPLKKIEEYFGYYRGKINSLKAKTKFLEGEDIRWGYLENNYVNFSGQGSTLHNSCMRYPRCQKFMDIYVHNPNHVRLFVLLDNNEKICARVLVWKYDNDSYFADRIYYAREIYLDTITEELKKLKIPIRTSVGFKIVLNNGTTINPIIKLDKFRFKYYPYMDTFYILDMIYGYLMINIEPTGMEFTEFVSKRAYITLSEQYGDYTIKGNKSLLVENKITEAIKNGTAKELAKKNQGYFDEKNKEFYVIFNSDYFYKLVCGKIGVPKMIDNLLNNPNEIKYDSEEDLSLLDLDYDVLLNKIKDKEIIFLNIENKLRNKNIEYFLNLLNNNDSYYFKYEYNKEDDSYTIFVNGCPLISGKGERTQEYIKNKKSSLEVSYSKNKEHFINNYKEQLFLEYLRKYNKIDDLINSISEDLKKTEIEYTKNALNKFVGEAINVNVTILSKEEKIELSLPKNTEMIKVIIPISLLLMFDDSWYMNITDIIVKNEFGDINFNRMGMKDYLDKEKINKKILNIL